MEDVVEKEEGVGWIATKYVAGQIVHVYPPGIAYGAFDLRDRGMDLPAEVTCWPRRTHYLLTTGGYPPRRMRPLRYQAILAEALGMNQHDFNVWAGRWQAEARTLARRHLAARIARDMEREHLVAEQAEARRRLTQWMANVIAADMSGEL